MSGPHPIVQLANRALSRDDTGKVVLDEQGALLLEAMIIEHAHDPALPDALRDLFGMMVMLEGELESPQAAFDLVDTHPRMRVRQRSLVWISPGPDHEEHVAVGADDRPARQPARHRGAIERRRRAAVRERLDAAGHPTLSLASTAARRSVPVSVRTGAPARAG